MSVGRLVAFGRARHSSHGHTPPTAPVQNLVKKRWERGDDEGPESAKERPMSPEDKEAVKASILNLMCAVPSDVQKQLSEALAIISQHDFPGG